MTVVATVAAAAAAAAVVALRRLNDLAYVPIKSFGLSLLAKSSKLFLKGVYT